MNKILKFSFLFLLFFIFSLKVNASVKFQWMNQFTGTNIKSESGRTLVTNGRFLKSGLNDVIPPSKQYNTSYGVPQPFSVWSWSWKFTNSQSVYPDSTYNFFVYSAYSGSSGIQDNIFETPQNVLPTMTISFYLMNGTYSVPCSTSAISLNGGIFESTCTIPHDMNSFNQILFYVNTTYPVKSPENTSSLYFSVTKDWTYSIELTSAIDGVTESNNTTNDKLDDLNKTQQETNQELSDMNDFISSDESPNSDISGLGNVSGLLPAGPLDSLLNIPFQFLSILTSSMSGTCVPLTGDFVWGSKITLPCFDEIIYGNVNSTLMNFISLIPASFILIKYFKHLYKKVERAVSLESTSDDEWGCI